MAHTHLSDLALHPTVPTVGPTAAVLARLVLALALATAGCGGSDEEGKAADTAATDASSDASSDAAGDAATTDSAVSNATTNDATSDDATANADSAGGDTNTGDDGSATDTSAMDATDGCAKGCDDENPCTTDSCVASACQHAAQEGSCDDGKPCTSDDSCQGGVCLGKPLQWTMTFGGNGEDVGRGAKADVDGSLVVVGHTKSTGAGGRDAWLVRIDAHGALVWDKTLGNDLDQEALDVDRYGDTWVASGAWREHGDPRQRGWLHGFDSKGETIASSVLPLTAATELHAVVLRDGPGGTVRAFAAGYREDDAGDLQMAIVRFDAKTMTTTWVQHYGDSGFDVAWDLGLRNEGGALFVGDTADSSGNAHVWHGEIDEDGKMLWQRTYFSDGEDSGWALSVRTDAAGQTVGATIVGSRKAKDAPVPAAWMMQTDAKGQTTWQQTTTAPAGATAFGVAQANGGGYVVAGRLSTTGTTPQAALWRTDGQGVTSWTWAGTGKPGNTGTAVGNAAAAWNDAFAVVGKFGEGSLSDLLVARTSMTGSTTCP